MEDKTKDEKFSKPVVVVVMILCMIFGMVLSKFSKSNDPDPDIASTSTSSSSSSYTSSSKPGSWSSCTYTCEINRQSCEQQGTSYQICKGGESYCMKDCCVMFQASDSTAAAWCR